MRTDKYLVFLGACEFSEFLPELVCEAVSCMVDVATGMSDTLMKGAFDMKVSSSCRINWGITSLFQSNKPCLN